MRDEGTTRFPLRLRLGSKERSRVCGRGFASRAGVRKRKMSSLDYLELCRLCLVKDRVSVPIFEGEGDVRQIFLKIAACLPVKVSREDKLPKKICDDCAYKVELFYQFWNTTANAEKQLLEWLGEVGLQDKQDYITDVLDPSMLKQEQSSESRLDGNMQQVDVHENNMGIGMMDNMGLGMPIVLSGTDQQRMAPAVPMDTTSGSVTSGSSAQIQSQTQTQTSTSTRQDEEEESSEDEENSEEECDVEEGLPVKEENEEEQSSRAIEPTTFVNVSLACDEAGPSGLQQQKITEIADMPEMPLPQTAEGDSKAGALLNRGGCFVYGTESIRMQPWQVVDLEGSLYYAFLPAKHNGKQPGQTQPEEEEEEEEEEKDAEEEEAEDHGQPDDLHQVDHYEVTKEKEENEVEKKTKMYPCEECNICFPAMKLLRRHRNAVHEFSERYECESCFKVCRSPIAFKMHLALEHASSEYRSEQDPLEAERQSYSCGYCSYESTNKSTLHSHMSRKHPGRNGSGGRKSKDGQEISCEICEYKCQNRRRLREHVERRHAAEYKYECEYCGKKFKVKGDMRLHVRFRHKEGPIICDVCGKTCSNSNSLYVHQKWAHFKPKYECEICKRRMVSQENLEQHVLLQHERRESFVCEECGKAFTENHRLKQHMMTHTGDRPYDCHICGKAFARRTAFRQHLLIHTGIRPYVCDICGKAFTQKPGLICHRKSHPGVLPPLPVVHIDHILSDFMKNR